MGVWKKLYQEWGSKKNCIQLTKLCCTCWTKNVTVSHVIYYNIRNIRSIASIETVFLLHCKFTIQHRFSSLTLTICSMNAFIFSLLVFVSSKSTFIIWPAVYPVTGIDAIINSGFDAQHANKQNGLKRFVSSSTIGCCSNPFEREKKIGEKNLIDSESFFLQLYSKWY